MPNSSAAAILLGQQAILGIAAAFWLSKVCTVVPEPYLDEVFHIRQAQAYLKEQWHVWDPKITTPPGLYLVSYVQNLILRPFGVQNLDSSLILRSTNVIFGGILLPVLIRDLLFLISSTQAGSAKAEASSFLYSAEGVRLGHTALNICLFPPLFFFYGLYYTDVLSVVAVLGAYHCYLRKEYVKVIFAGLASLLFRQTNVFWVAVFLGGLELVRTLPRGRTDVEFPRRVTYYDVILGSWNHACIYDPLISEAYIEDYVKSLISLAVSALALLFTNPMTMFWNLSSYVLVLLAFGEFVLWNGGVVLGDKENHVASIHLAQMLYIWPYFFFFSLPLLAPYLFGALIPQDLLPCALQTGPLKSSIPRITIILPILAAMLATVHYNTIVHPFTLADNRHYMFYIFRILLRHPSVKYLAVPVYFLTGWACLTALGGPPTIPPAPTQNPAQTKQQPNPAPRQQPRPSPNSTNRVTFLLIWLLSTTLTLSSAPLVEPRYLILPWLIWRLQLASATPPRPTAATRTSDPTPASNPNNKPSPQTSQPPNSDNPSTKPPVPTQWVSEILWLDPLWLETAWFLLINITTGYVFLNWGFEWPQEPGRVQRFMW